jgi:hypothetical protein
MLYVLRCVLLCVVGCVCVSSASAAPTVVADSGVAGPTVLVLTDPASNDFTVDVAVRQAATWKLSRGRLLAAPATDPSTAWASASPDVVLVLRNVRSSRVHAHVQSRGVDEAAFLEMLNGLIDAGGERVLTSVDAAAAIAAAATQPTANRTAAPRAPATLPTTRSLSMPESPQLPAGNFKAIRVTLAIKSGGTVPAARTRLFRHAIHHVLATEKMTDSDPWTLIRRQPETIEVALYAGVGSNASPGVSTFPRLFDADPMIRYTYVGPAEIRRPGVLDQFDVMFFCGGMSNQQGAAIGAEGAEAVRAFVERGGGYVGTCAGSYLATSGFKWSLKIIAADVMDYAHWLRGSGPVDVELTPEGKKVFGDVPLPVSIYYANGPLLGPAAKADGLQPFTTLGIFRSDMAKSAPGGKMPNTPAIISGLYGKGRVLCFSPHPEYTKGIETFINRAVRWSVDRPVDQRLPAQVPAKAE